MSHSPWGITSKYSRSPSTFSTLPIHGRCTVSPPHRPLHGRRLEHSLRNFATLTVGDQISVSYNSKLYELLVMEAKPNNGSGGISVLETDLQVDFAAPVGYEEPTSTAATRPRETKSIVAHDFYY